MNPANSKYGTLTLAASTATAIPMIAGETAYNITNSDTAIVYLGTDSSVTSTTGTPIPANGGTATVTMTYENSVAGTSIYVYSVAGTASNAVAYLAVA